MDEVVCSIKTSLDEFRDAWSRYSRDRYTIKGTKYEVKLSDDNFPSHSIVLQIPLNLKAYELFCASNLHRFKFVYKLSLVPSQVPRVSSGSVCAAQLPGCVAAAGACGAGTTVVPGVSLSALAWAVWGFALYGAANEVRPRCWVGLRLPNSSAMKSCWSLRCSDAAVRHTSCSLRTSYGLSAGGFSNKSWTSVANSGDSEDTSSQDAATARRPPRCHWQLFLERIVSPTPALHCEDGPRIHPWIYFPGKSSGNGHGGSHAELQNPVSFAQSQLAFDNCTMLQKEISSQYAIYRQRLNHCELLLRLEGA